jgi:hypothetical protein
MTNSITPPPELVKQWLAEPEYVSGWNGKCTMISVTDHRFSNICAKAAQWGADQELEVCLRLLDFRGFSDADIEGLRAARRPNPPSLKEQALEALQFVDEKLDLPLHNHCNAIHTIRRALEALDD